MNTDDGRIFPLGKKVETNCVGDVYVKRLTLASRNCSVYSVLFMEGVRSNWYTLPGEQILLVMCGRGYYQEENTPVEEWQEGNVSAEELVEGDVVEISSNVKHWCGASPNRFMTLISVVSDMEKDGVLWLEPLSETEYKK